MKLVPKLTAALLAGTVLVLMSNAALRVRRETAMMHADRASAHALAGNALGTAVGSVWRNDGKGEAMRIVAMLDGRDGRVHARWIDRASASALRGDVAALAALPDGQTLTERVATAAGDERVSYTAVSSNGERVGYVELSETLEAEQRAARGILFDTLLTTISMTFVFGLLAGVLGLWLVGRPVAALCEKARRIGAGDFSDPLVLRHGDELGQLAAELNSTSVRLEEASQRVARETAARIATLEQLRHVDRLATVGRLASGVAHELGTPLNVVLARAKMIASGDTEGEATKEYAGIIADAAARMTKIIRQLLAFARRKATSKARCDLRRVTHDTIELLRPIAEKAAVTITLEEGPPAVAEVDGDAIQQVLTNIFVNAIHAMPKGGEVVSRIGFETRAAPAEPVGRHLVLTVKDAGDGIAAGDLDHIFEPFFTTKEVGRGTGLGLSVAHGIVEDHAGFIDVESTLGHGSVFTVHLPAPEDS